jgi:predicted nucleic acid-binding protein
MSRLWCKVYDRASSPYDSKGFLNKPHGCDLPIGHEHLQRANAAGYQGVGTSSLPPAEDRVAICTITRGEIMYGLLRLPQGRRRTNLEAEATHLFSQMVCMSAPESAADAYARAKTMAQRAGMSLDENDLWIAATALSLGAVLVTMDSDFQRVGGLRVEDWTS